MKAQNRKKRKRIRTVVIPPKFTDGRRVIDADAARRGLELSAFKETVERRMTQDNVPESVAKSQEHGHVIGRLAEQLRWDKELAGQRIAAGFRFSEVVTEYRKDVLGSPNPNPPAMDMNRIGGFSTRGVSQERAKSLTNDFMAIHQALGQAGRASYLFRLLDMVCVEDAPTENWPDGQIRDLEKALDAVSSA